MTDPATETALTAITRALVADGRVRLAVAHGSRIDGEPTPDSDLDLFIVLDADVEAEMDLIGELCSLDLGGVSIDPHTYRLERFSGEGGNESFYRLVLARGHVLLGDPAAVFGPERAVRLSEPLDDAEAARLYATNKLAAAARQLDMAANLEAFFAEHPQTQPTSGAEGAVECLVTAALMSAEALGLARSGRKPRGESTGQVISAGLAQLGHADPSLGADADRLMARRWAIIDPAESLTWDEYHAYRPRAERWFEAVHAVLAPELGL